MKASKNEWTVTQLQNLFHMLIVSIYWLFRLLSMLEILLLHVFDINLWKKNYKWTQEQSLLLAQLVEESKRVLKGKLGPNNGL